jgi:hypothetical protein
MRTPSLRSYEDTNVTIIETQETDQLALGWEGTVQTRTRRFIAHPTPVTCLVFDELTVLEALSLMTPPIVIGAEDQDWGSYTVKKISLDPSSTAIVYSITVTYTGMSRLQFIPQQPPEGGGDTEILSEGPVLAEPSFTPKTRTFDLFRTGALALPTEGDASGFNDMGGDKADQAGQPYPWWVRQLDIVVDCVWNAVDGYPDIQQWVPYMNTRNNYKFMNLSAGSVMYLGPVFAPAEKGWFIVSHKFLYDQFYHLSQRPILWTDGRPQLDTGTGAPNGVGKALTVFWFQPYPKVDVVTPGATFKDLFTTDQWDYLHRGFPPDPPPPP